MDTKYQYFTVEELQCHGSDCCGGQTAMDHKFMVDLVAMRRELGFPLYLSSAYRCPLHNTRESSTGMDGPHTTGRAVDISIQGNQAFKLIECAYRYGMTGFGISQKGSKRFIHIDNLTGMTRPWIWTY